MSARVGINGFGRTGRAAFRAAHERGEDIDVHKTTSEPETP
jgi:glyceraldehyde-3-phosphate dehydrogenase/erythrose-4-phosphate dehydrogenase